MMLMISSGTGVKPPISHEALSDLQTRDVVYFMVAHSLFKAIQAERWARVIYLL